MIIKYVNEYDFTEALRQDEYAGWSYGARVALYEYYDQLSDDIGEDIQLDVVAIRCEWGEYETCLEYAREFLDFTETDRSELDDDELEAEAREWLENMTDVLEAKTPAIGDGHKLGDYITSYVIRNF